MKYLGPRFAALYLLGLIANICASFQAPLVPPLGQAFAVPPQVVGMVMSSQFIAYLFAGSLIGRLVARMGVRRSAQMGLGLIAVTALSASRATTLALLVFANIAQGLGMLIVVVAAQIGVAMIAPEKDRARLLAIWATSPLIGLALGLLLSSPFASLESWPTAFLALAALATALVATSAALPSDSLSQPGKASQPGGLSGEAAVLWMCAAMAFSVIAINGAVSSWPTYLAQAYHTSSGQIGSTASMAMMAGVPGSLAVGLGLSRGWPPQRLLGWIVPFAVVGAVVVFGAFVRFGLVMVGMVFWHVASGAITALLFATMPSVLRNPANLPSATGLLYQFAAVGTMLGAPIYLGLAATSHAAMALSMLTCGAVLAMAASVLIAARGTGAQPIERI